MSSDSEQQPPSPREIVEDDLSSAPNGAGVHLVHVHTLEGEPLLLSFSAATATTLGQLFEEIAHRMGLLTQEIIANRKVYYLGSELTDFGDGGGLQTSLADCGLLLVPVDLSSYGTVATDRQLDTIIATNAAFLYVGQRAAELFSRIDEFKTRRIKPGTRGEGAQLTLDKLSLHERRFAHEVAAQFGLYHQSSGKADSRGVVIRHGANKQQEEQSSQVAFQERKARKAAKFQRATGSGGMSCIIEDFLFLGSGRDANDEEQIRKNRIGAILNVAAEWPRPSWLDVKPRGRSAGSSSSPTGALADVVYRKMELKDEEEQDIHSSFQEAISFISTAKSQGRRVLVHCVIGKSRSTSFVLAYLVHEEGMSLRQAYEHVKQQRSIIHPNDGFIRQLMHFEQKLRGGVVAEPLDWAFKPSARQLQEEVKKQRQVDKDERTRKSQEAVQGLFTADLMVRTFDSVLDDMGLPPPAAGSAPPKDFVSRFLSAVVLAVTQQAAVNSSAPSQQQLDGEPDNGEPAAAAPALDRKTIQSATSALAREWLLSVWGKQ